MTRVLVLSGLLGLLTGGLGGIGLLLDDLLDDLLLFDQESSDDSLLDGVGAEDTTVGSRDGLVGLGDGSVLSWSHGRNTLQRHTGVTTLWSGSQLLGVLGTQDTTWGLDNLDLVGTSVVCKKELVDDPGGWRLIGAAVEVANEMWCSNSDDKHLIFIQTFVLFFFPT